MVNQIKIGPEIPFRESESLRRSMNAALAPIGPAWLAAMDQGIKVHAHDGYHANAAGAWLAAMLLAAALGVADPYTAPPPGGVPPSDAAMLTEIARAMTGSTIQPD